MARVDVKCPFCGQIESIKKHGLSKTKHRHNLCQIRRQSFQFDYVYRASLPRMKAQIVDLSMNNAGILLAQAQSFYAPDFRKTTERTQWTSEDYLRNLLAT